MESVAVDIYPGCGSLGGIFSRLLATNSDWSLVVAYAMPFLHADLLTYLNSLQEWYSTEVPVLKSRPEPNHTLNSKMCLPHIKQRLNPNDLNISRFYLDVQEEYVPDEEIGRIDPDFLRLFYVISAGDLNLA